MGDDGQILMAPACGCDECGMFWDAGMCQLFVSPAIFAQWSVVLAECCIAGGFDPAPPAPGYLIFPFSHSKFYSHSPAGVNQFACGCGCGGLPG